MSVYYLVKHVIGTQGGGAVPVDPPAMSCVLNILLTERKQESKLSLDKRGAKSLTWAVRLI